MADIVERLRKLSKDMLAADIDMKLPAGSVDPSDAADEIERLRAELAALKEQEPVAWRWRWKTSGSPLEQRFADPDLYSWAYRDCPLRDETLEKAEMQPLYAAPVPAVDKADRLRKQIRNLGYEPVV